MLAKFNLLNRNTKICAFVTVALLVVSIVLSMNTIKYYTQSRTTVNATVTSIIDASSSDSSSYHIYVEYRYGGKEYSDVLLDDTSDYGKYNEGDKVKAEIYTKEPQKIANDTSLNGVVFIVAFAGFLVATIHNIKKDLA